MYNPIKVRVPRAAMPQIKSDLMPEFIDELRKEGVLVMRNRVYAHSLRPSQKEIHEDNVSRLMMQEANLRKPVLVSNDWFVLDGHHRWEANRRLKATQPVWFVDMPACEALSYMARFAARHPESCGAKQ